MIIEKYTMTELAEVTDLSETVRGEGGFGSTGVGEKRQAQAQFAAASAAAASVTIEEVKE